MLKLFFFLNALSVMFVVGTAIYGLFLLRTLSLVWKWSIYYMCLQGLIGIIGWACYLASVSNSFLVLFNNILSHSFTIMILLIFSYMINRRSTTIGLGILLFLMIGTLNALDKLDAHVKASIMGLITFLLGIYLFFRFFSWSRFENEKLTKVAYFWCLMSFLISTAGSVSEYVLHFMVITRHQYSMIIFQPLVSAIPPLLAQIAFLYAIWMETYGKRN